jgi:nucleotide-binding universal stress UspA family protein
MKAECDKAGLPMEYKSFDGKNWECLVQDITESDYDLVVMGALGMGAVKDSMIGSVTDRVVRRIRVDSLVIRDTHPFREDASDRIVVAIDGSPQSFAGLKTALELARCLKKRVEAVSVYDPYLHYAMFNGIVDVLSAEASKIFRFKEQEQLHEEIIDTGLAKIYESHLRVAESLARDEGMEIKTTLFDGKAFKKVLQYVRQDPPWLLVVGRIGVHSASQMDLGSNTDNLLRLAPVNVLLSSRSFVPPIDVQAEASVAWTGEAELRMEKVPAAFRAITRTAICRYAMERGHSIISSSIIDQAVSEVMPEHAARAMGVEPVTVRASMDGLEAVATWICRRCGRPTRGQRPETCPVCEGLSFQAVDKASIAAVAAREGGIEEEEAFDGFKVKWTAEAKEVLNRVPKGYERRRVKARIEKIARVQKLPSITRDFAEANLDDAYGPVAEVVGDQVPPKTVPADEAAPLIWTDEAVSRMEKVPGGFMRMLARTKVEEFARKIHADTITRDVAEGGLVDARMMMDQALKAHSPEVVESAMRAHGYGGAASETPAETAPGWTEDGVRRLNEVEVRAMEKFDPARARELAEHAAESRAARTSEAINAAFLERLGIKIGYGHPLSPKTFEHRFTWSPEAEARLQNLPSYCRELSRWRVEWTAAKKGFGPVITPKEMDVKFEMWGEVSEALQQKGAQMAWDVEAEKRLENMPPFVKGQVMEAIEGNARELGENRVSSRVMDVVIQKWIETGDFHEGRYGFKA